MSKALHWRVLSAFEADWRLLMGDKDRRRGFIDAFAYNAYSISDNEAARHLNKARQKLFRRINESLTSAA